jgi:hypothetical protein
MLSLIYLGYVVLMLLGFGIAFLLAPSRMAGLVDIQVPTSSALSDIRAVYGGLEIGLGLVVAWCMLDPGRVPLGLGMAGVLFACVAAGRGFGMLRDRPVSALTSKVFAVELGTALVGLLLWGKAA